MHCVCESDSERETTLHLYVQENIKRTCLCMCVWKCTKSSTMFVCLNELEQHKKGSLIGVGTWCLVPGWECAEGESGVKCVLQLGARLHCVNWWVGEDGLIWEISSRGGSQPAGPPLTSASRAAQLSHFTEPEMWKGQQQQELSHQSLRECAHTMSVCVFVGGGGGEDTSSINHITVFVPPYSL